MPTKRGEDNGADNAILEPALVKRLEDQEIDKWKWIVQDRPVEFPTYELEREPVRDDTEQEQVDGA